MSSSNPNKRIPSKILYTMIRVTDLERSIEFYTQALGMKELRRETFTEGKFTLVFVGYEDSNASIELTYNWGENSYQHGTRFGHIALEVEDIYSAIERLQDFGIKVSRNAGPMIFAVDETGHKENIAFIEDPDGYKIELVEKND